VKTPAVRQAKQRRFSIFDFVDCSASVSKAKPQKPSLPDPGKPSGSQKAARVLAAKPEVYNDQI
jgi:hypothetical protein